MICKQFLSFSRLSFFVYCFLCCIEAFQFDVVPLVDFCFCCFLFLVSYPKNHCCASIKELTILFYFLIFLFIYFYLFIFGCDGSRCCAWTFSSCSERGLLFIAVRGLLTVVASLVAEHGLQAHRLQQLWFTDSRAQAQQLWRIGLVAPRHVGSSQTRARTRVPRIGRQILNHCTTREALIFIFLIKFLLEYS